jgi:3-hydroxybutyryl-CoA dehydrogenase
MSQTLHTVAVIGGGTMGAGIVEVAASAGHAVRLYDISPEAITRAIDGIAERLPASAAEKSAPSRRRRCWRALRQQPN